MTIESVGLDPDQIRRIWEGRAETVATPGQFGAEGVLTLDRLRRNLPMRCALPATAMPLRVAAASPALPPPAPTPRQVDPPADQDPLARWGDSLKGTRSVSGMLSEFWDGAVRTSAEARDTVLGWTRGPAAAQTVAVNPRASLIIAESAGAGSLAGRTILVTAPNPSMLKASVSCLVDPVVWTRLVGQAAFLDASDGSLSVVQPERVDLIETQAWTLPNFRLVSAAWLSLNPAYYVGMTLLMALCLGLATTSLVRHLGRQNR
ncbi:hypothetical protein AEGHOMDF_3754 [Methylobacterium soli]|nr:hypothetical protein AEGHOMDF_3754 [Methylobacterium soli]